MPSIATKFQYVNSPFFIFSFLLTTCFGPYWPLGDTRISNIEQHTSQKEETKNNNRRKKDLHCLQLADRLASQKDWRTAHTIKRGYKCLLTLNFNIFYILYMRPVTVNFNVFTTFILRLITCIGDHESKYQYRHTSSCVRTTDPL
jgi:hypothetical protein